MEIQQKDNEILVAYVLHFKMEAKRCDFNRHTAAICIFVKGLWEVQNFAQKVYEKDPKTLLEVMKLVEKFNTGQQVTVTLSPPTVNMMSSNALFVAGKAI